MLDTYEGGYLKAIIDLYETLNQMVDNNIKVNKKTALSLLKRLMLNRCEREAFRMYGGGVLFRISPKGEVLEIIFDNDELIKEREKCAVSELQKQEH